MGEVNRIIARYLDGRVVKGTTEDFQAGRPNFHLLPLGESKTRVILCAQLKAVFFVREFEGRADRSDLRGFTNPTGEQNQGKKIAVRFKDGETICGHTMAYTGERPGFFLVPADPGSNNIRIYVVRSATTKIAIGPNADALANAPDSRAA